MQNKSLCNQTDLSTQALNQLETRPEGCPHRCSKCELACLQGICFPFLQLGTRSPKQSSSRPDRASPCCYSRTGATSKQEISTDKPRTGSPNLPTPPSVYHVSSNATKQKDFLKTLPTYLLQQLVPPHLRHIGIKLASLVQEGGLIRFQQL